MAAGAPGVLARRPDAAARLPAGAERSRNDAGGTGAVTLVATLAGLGLLLLAARDIFDTLFHPHGRGVISERLIHLVWWSLRSAFGPRPHFLTLAGPIAFVVVFLSWVSMVAVGGALVFAPRLPDEFVLAPGVEATSTDDFIDAFYVSLVNLTSLGFGDVVPAEGWLRILSPLQALFGLGLLTASVSWILSIYGVLAGLRSTAREISLFCDAAESPGQRFDELDAATEEAILRGLTTRIVAARRDLRHFPIAYYFDSREAEHVLSISISRLLVTLGRAEHSSSGVSLERSRFDAACDELLATVAEEFLDSPGLGTGETLARWRRDHGW